MLNIHNSQVIRIFDIFIFRNKILYDPHRNIDSYPFAFSCKQGGEGRLIKCQRYYISLCSKLVNEGGGEVKNSQYLVNVVYEYPQLVKLSVADIPA